MWVGQGRTKPTFVRLYDDIDEYIRMSGSLENRSSTTSSLENTEKTVLRATRFFARKNLTMTLWVMTQITSEIFQRRLKTVIFTRQYALWNASARVPGETTRRASTVARTSAPRTVTEPNALRAENGPERRVRRRGLPRRIERRVFVLLRVLPRCLDRVPVRGVLGARVLGPAGEATAGGAATA